MIVMQTRIFTEPQQGASYDTLLAVARATEDLGFDAFFRSDHYLKFGPVSGLPGPTDAWLTLAGLARETARIRLGTLMSPATFRHPGPMAITVAQVDQMSGGRVEFGFGAGWYAAEHAAYAIPFPDVGERFARFEEQLAIITGLWDTPEGRRSRSAASTTRSPTHPDCPSQPSGRGLRCSSAAPGSAGRRGWPRGTRTSTTSRSAGCRRRRPRSAGCGTRAPPRAAMHRR
jgi:alkanesulfonate monooxygenase SsuD/methylene tetrahydromethanopterin reductase-like flavin-dependent oxidoreductase (luciferase family)